MAEWMDLKLEAEKELICMNNSQDVKMTCAYNDFHDNTGTCTSDENLALLPPLSLGLVYLLRYHSQV